MAFENLKTAGITYLLTKLKDVFLQIKDAVKSVNGELPDETGDITINSVPYAANLESDTSHRNTGAFIQRTSGGDSSVVNGDAWLMVVRGNSEHTGYVAESIEWSMTVIGDDDHITATFNRDTFVNYVENSGTTTLAYSTSWSADPSLYGFTITGTPEAGDTITVVYVKEERGTITVANPQTFVSTGWNLFDVQNGYAKVVQYAFDYRIEGPYSSIKFATTPSGTQSSITVIGGNFAVPSDGYVIVTGGTGETAIYATWEDWTDGYTGAFEAYNASTIDLTNVMSEYFPYGLLKAGTTADEIDLNLGQAISRVERLSYTAANLATAKNSGREFEYDENFIYLARASAVSSGISVDGSYIVNDHGIEYFTTTAIEVPSEVLYGNNLKNKLERDVLTISQQTLSSSEQDQVRTNIGAASQSDMQYLQGRIALGDDLASEAAVGSALDSVLSTMGNFAIKNAQFRYEGTTGVLINGYRYLVEISRGASATSSSVFMYSSGAQAVVQGMRNSNGWVFRDLNATIPQKVLFDATAKTERTYYLPSNGRLFVVGIGGIASCHFAEIVNVTSAGVVGRQEITKGSSVTIDISVANRMKVTFSNAYSLYLFVFATSSNHANEVVLLS